MRAARANPDRHARPADNPFGRYKGHAYYQSAGVYSTKDPLTGQTLSFGARSGGRKALESFLDARLALARSEVGRAR